MKYVWMAPDGYGNNKEGAYKGLDPDISEQYVLTQFYAGMEKLDTYLSRHAAFDVYMEANPS